MAEINSVTAFWTWLGWIPLIDRHKNGDSKWNTKHWKPISYKTTATNRENYEKKNNWLSATNKEGFVEKADIADSWERNTNRH